MIPLISQASFLVAWPTVRDLLLCAKHLFSEANRISNRARTVTHTRDVPTRE